MYRVEQREGKSAATPTPAAGRGLLMFDLDGTLIDSREDLTTAVNLLRHDYGLAPLPVDTVASYVGDGIRALVTRSLRGHDIDLDQAVQKCAVHYRKHLHDRTTLYPGVREGLEALHGSGYRIALISNKPGATCLELLSHFKIAPCFSCVLGGGDTEHLKPHPQPLLEAMRRVGAKPEDSWMIGDHFTDIEAARRAGVRSIWLSYGIGKTDKDKPEVAFGSFAAMTEFLLR